MYPVQAILATCCQRYQESTHLLCILFRQCWLLAAKDIRNQHIYQVSCLGDVGCLLPKTYGINTCIRYPAQEMLVIFCHRPTESTLLLGIQFMRCWCTWCQRHKESTHLLSILFWLCQLLAAKDIRNQHIYQVSCLSNVGYLLPKTS